MRPTPWLSAEPFRFQSANSAYTSSYGEPFGAFIIKRKTAKHQPTIELRCLVSSGAIAQQDYGSINHAWDHVSVSVKNRCPTWNEMTYVKDLFFLPEETVIQFHPPQSEYINLHPYTLHLWKPLLIDIPLPPQIMV